MTGKNRLINGHIAEFLHLYPFFCGDKHHTPKTGDIVTVNLWNSKKLRTAFIVGGCVRYLLVHRQLAGSETKFGRRGFPELSRKRNSPLRQKLLNKAHQPHSTNTGTGRNVCQEAWPARYIAPYCVDVTNFPNQRFNLPRRYFTWRSVDTVFQEASSNSRDSLYITRAVTLPQTMASCEFRRRSEKLSIRSDQL